MNFLSLIESKREGKTLAPEQIQYFVREFTAGKIPDYQMAAMLMAIYFRGLNTAETTALTLAMRDSGDVLKFPKDKRPLVDKHSTGGIGDKVSLPLAPLLACLGFRVPMISGRGLGITGGTLDKLDSIPGFKTLLPAEKIVAQVQKVGCVICGQTDSMVPADKKIYALRDASGTVPSIPLITASILSKKLAESLDALILDVKFGCAAFMQTKADARKLAQGDGCARQRMRREHARDFDGHEHAAGPRRRQLAGGEGKRGVSRSKRLPASRWQGKSSQFCRQDACARSPNSVARSRLRRAFAGSNAQSQNRSPPRANWRRIV